MSAVLFDTNALIAICRENDVAKLEVFGSTARGEASDDSDIDLLVEFSKRKSLLALVSVERKMSAALSRKVDLLTEAAISPYLLDSIKRDLRGIYERDESFYGVDIETVWLTAKDDLPPLKIEVQKILAELSSNA